ncbi:MAG: glycosyltransferase family 2 protein [Gammaproteobacteria bacterium]|nr:glycosyltransferase family 2 protein [Gammaproteobacteria bacterium]NNF49858.1 glycosyltransferase family 2 protein [Woeseiaceae bacterium]MBT8094680.1 glycosyltransferase family 2 protein [Gammaproteobacteria bacterium]MBT8104941.1 glycosyltransferase family 2 protein [Gammaproteobacteria bacterium]NNK24955.1 glycosyltransferase family 2 protein [Woeseiaceae bacterium]
MSSLSIVIPAKNESAVIGDVVKGARAKYPQAEVIVVDDGSDDGTADVAANAGAKVLRHPESLGNGAAVKAGARAASGEIIAFMDGDGQHDAAEFDGLLARLDEGFDMVIGARDSGSHANFGRLYANGVYNVVASWLTGRRIPDLTSGFRVARAELFRRFLYLLPNGFSYPTTITMAFLRSGYPIRFEPIPVAKRVGKSHIRPFKDGLRFLVIIFKIATLYAPLKIFAPVAAVFFTTGCGWYAYTYATMGRFTNMSMLLFSASVIVFLIGLISEQITALTYSKT